MKRVFLLLIVLTLYSCNDANPLVPDTDADSDDYAITIADYGAGTACGGAILSYNNQIYRTYDGGIAPLSNELEILSSGKIGDYNSIGNIYHAEIINGNIWLSITDYSNFNEIRVLNNTGEEIGVYEVGINPGDFASWNDTWVFIANEGNYGSSNGSISMIDNQGNIFSIDNVGDIVQSIEVYNNKLIVLVNNSHLIKVYDITNEGLSLPGIEVSTNASGPREMVVVDNKLYFTNWNTKDVKVFNLHTYQIENSLELNAIPEDILFDGSYLWVSSPNINLYDQNLGSSLFKIDAMSLSIIDTYEVGLGPESLLFRDGDIYVARKTFSSDWYTTYHGTSKIDN